MRNLQWKSSRNGLLAALVALWLAMPAPGQTTSDDRAAPVFPKAFTNPDEFFERMFGKSTPEEQKILESIEVTAKEEREFGQPQVEAFLDELNRQGLKALRKGKDVEYMRRLVETVRPFMKNAKRYEKMTIYVVDSPHPLPPRLEAVDARSFPGGTLFFFKRLLSFAQNEAALVGIVGHELSHLDRGHLLLPLKRARALERTFEEGAASFDPQAFFAQGTTMMRLVGRPFRPEDEAEADRDGAEWAYRADYDPREMAALFFRLHERDRSPRFPFASFFRTHPYSDDRHDAIMKQFDELQASDPRETLYRGQKNLAQRIPRSQQSFPE